jgi:hypothetical protein
MSGVAFFFDRKFLLRFVCLIGSAWLMRIEIAISFLTILSRVRKTFPELEDCQGRNGSGILILQGIVRCVAGADAPGVSFSRRDVTHPFTNGTLEAVCGSGCC